MSGTEQGQDGRAEGRREVTRPRIGRDQEPRAADARLCQTHSQFLVGQTDHPGMSRQRDDFSRGVALSGAAEDQGLRAGLLGQASG